MKYNYWIWDVTAIVATYDRYYALLNLIQSFSESEYSDLNFIVVDSSPLPSDINYKNVKHIHVPSDTWISKQRNIALENVRTPLFLLLDDDYLCVSGTNINKMLNYINSWEVDIIWWNLINILSEQYSFDGSYDFIDNTLYHRVEVKNNNWLYDVIFNFFIAKTDQIKWIWWRDDELKYAREHDDFFLNAKRNWLKVWYDKEIIVEHYSYSKHHWWTLWISSVEHFKRKWNIENKVEVRYIERENEKYISYFNAIKWGSEISLKIKEKIKSIYGDYPIKIQNAN